jgi:hypothetical protein
MKDTSSMHKQVQEMCDCYATNDPLKEMSTIDRETDTRQAAAKWIALAALHGVNSNADKICITRGDGGQIRVVAEYKITELPAPGQAVGNQVFDAVREISHIDGTIGNTALALGIRDSSIDLNVDVLDEVGKETITITFPDK